MNLTTDQNFNLSFQKQATKMMSDAHQTQQDQESVIQDINSFEESEFRSDLESDEERQDEVGGFAPTFLIDTREKQRILKKGALIAFKDSKNGSKMSNDYICESESCKVLFITVSEYFMTYDRFMIQEKQKIANLIHEKFRTFSAWSQPKMSTWCENFRVKVFQEGATILEDEASVDDIIFVKKGSLRVDKQLTFESQNIMPSQLKGDDG